VSVLAWLDVSLLLVLSLHDAAVFDAHPVPITGRALRASDWNELELSCRFLAQGRYTAPENPIEEPVATGATVRVIVDSMPQVILI